MNYLYELNQLNRLNELLLEDIESVKKQYSHVPEKDFYRIIELDPTYKPNRDSVGKYGKWLLGLYKKDNPLKWDSDSIKDVINTYDEKKNDRAVTIEKDISKFKSIRDMIDAIDNSGEAELSHRQKVRQNQKARHGVNLGTDADLVYEDEKWEVFIPKTYAASCKLGQGTSWCTASTEHDGYYKSYTAQGPLYIIINKEYPEEKYQFHFESSQFMNSEDNSINFEWLFKDNDGLKKFFLPKILKWLNLPDLSPEEDITVTFEGDDIYRLFDDINDYRDRLGAKFIDELLSDPWELFSFVDWGVPSEQRWFEFIDFRDNEILDEFIRIGLLEEADKSKKVSEIQDTFEDNYFESGNDEIYGCFVRAFSVAMEDSTIHEALDGFVSALREVFERAEIVPCEDGYGIKITTKFGDLLSILDIDDFGSNYWDDNELGGLKDLIKEKISEDFEFTEPYYGWGESLNEDLFKEYFLEEIYNSF